MRNGSFISLILLCAVLYAAECGGDDTLLTKSLPFRTALHHDPSLKAPFEKLVKMFSEKGKKEDLITVYRSHLKIYPQDKNALTVLIRLLIAFNDPGAGAASRDAVEKFANDAYLHFLLYETFKKEHNQDDLAVLDKAIKREKLPGRKQAWIDILIPEAIARERSELALYHLKKLAELADGSPALSLAAAEKMIQYSFFKEALELAEKVLSAEIKPPPETYVDLQMAASRAEAGLGRYREAGGRLDDLLKKVTVGYWRRDEIFRRRISLVAGGEEREAMLSRARKEVDRNPHSPEAAISYARLLSELGFRRKSLEVLKAAGKRMPDSLKVEEEILDLYDLLRDERGRAAYLETRLKELTERDDLKIIYVKTLFLLDRSTKALKEFNSMTVKIPQDQQLKVILSMARFLRRGGMIKNSGVLFEKAVSLTDRLDICREFAEVLFALNKHDTAKRMLSRALPEDASIENILDIVSFMIEKHLYREAEKALVEYSKRDNKNIDIKLLLADALINLGKPLQAKETLLEVRNYIDSPSRYRQWLIKMVEFNAAFNSVEEFIEIEKQRIFEYKALGKCQPSDLIICLAEMIGEEGSTEAAMDLLLEELSRTGNLKAGLSIRKKLVKLMGDNPDYIEEKKKQLNILIEQGSGDECIAQLALVYIRQNRSDLAAVQLRKIEIKNIHDPSLAFALVPILKDYNLRVKYLQLLEHITHLDPSDRQNWEDLLTELAAEGREKDLRDTARRLVAGVDRMPVSAKTRVLLQKHIKASYWRSIAELLARGKGAAFQEALSMIHAVEKQCSNTTQWLWVAWTRAYLYNKLSLHKAREEAVRELRRIEEDIKKSHLKNSPQKTSDTQEDDSPAHSEQIRFPDGLCVHLSNAIKLFEQKKPGTSDHGYPRPAQDLKPPFRVRWVFASDNQMPVTSILPDKEGRTFILDASGILYCIHSISGKVLWTSEEDIFQKDTHGGSASSRYTICCGNKFPVPVMDMNSIYIANQKNIISIDKKSGSINWKSSLDFSSLNPEGSRCGVSLFLEKDTLLACDPIAAAVARIDTRSGKILFYKKYSEDYAGRTAPSSASGVAYDPPFLMVFGGLSSVIDMNTHTTVWSFDPSGVLGFPVSLPDPESEKKTALAPAANRQQRRIMSWSGSGYQPPHQIPPHIYQQFGHSQYQRRYMQRAGVPKQVYLDYLAVRRAQPYGNRRYRKRRQNVSYVAPLVNWAENNIKDRLAVLVGNKLVCFRNNEARVADLTLPLKGKVIPCTGTYIGKSGNLVLVIGHRILDILHISRKTKTQFDIGNVYQKEQQSLSYVQAAVDGCLVYISGSEGIMCVNPHTRALVFFEAWPDKIKEIAAAAHGYPHIKYYYQGLHARVMPNTWTLLQPNIVVCREKLFTAVAPDTVVCIESKTR